MARKSRRRRSLLGSRGSRSTAPNDETPEPGSDPGETEGEVSVEEDASAEPESLTPVVPSPESGADTTEETEEAVQPVEAPPPDATEETEEAPAVEKTPWEVPPHWPKPRYVARHEMMRGHVREPEDPPLLRDWEMHLVGGLMALALGFVLTGGGGLFGLWLVMGWEIFGPAIGG